MIVQTDGETTIRELAEELARVRLKPTRTRTTPAHAVQSTGAVEATIGQVRTLRAHLEPMLDVVVRPNMCIWP